MTGRLPAFERAVASGRPAIVHCIVHPEALTPGRTLTEISQAGRQALAQAQR